MNTRQSLREIVSHGFAASVVITLSVLFAVVAYAGLLAWAIVAGLPLGGPLALPFMMVVALITSTLAVVCGLFPATLIARFVCRRLLGWSFTAEAPVATLLTLGAALGLALAAGSVFGLPVTTSVAQGLLLGLLLLVPLGIYWWVMHVSNWGIRHGQRLVERISARPTNRITSH